MATSDGLCRMASCQESGLDTLASSTVGKSTSIANEDDTIVQRIIVLKVDVTTS